MFRYLLAVMIVMTCHHAEAQVTPDVRKVVWGMTKEEVRNTENVEEIHMDLPGLTPEGLTDTNSRISFLTYRTTVLELNAFLVYSFDSDRLVGMVYGFNQGHSSYNFHASDFDHVNASLYGKYGRWSSDVDSSTDLQRKAGMDMGFLLSLGGYHRTVEWQTPRTVIVHQISRDINEVSHVLTYESIENYNVRKKAAQDDI